MWMEKKKEDTCTNHHTINPASTSHNIMGINNPRHQLYRTLEEHLAGSSTQNRLKGRRATVLWKADSARKRRFGQSTHAEYIEKTLKIFLGMKNDWIIKNVSVHALISHIIQSRTCALWISFILLCSLSWLIYSLIKTYSFI